MTQGSVVAEFAKNFGVVRDARETETLGEFRYEYAGEFRYEYADEFRYAKRR